MLLIKYTKILLFEGILIKYVTYKEEKKIRQWLSSGSYSENKNKLFAK